MAKIPIKVTTKEPEVALPKTLTYLLRYEVLREIDREINEWAIKSRANIKYFQVVSPNFVLIAYEGAQV
jgi:hypothetical protein